eukprot:COSAG04_NODE_1344_length_7145_cov_59.296764_3_plen_58_part_00
MDGQPVSMAAHAQWSSSLRGGAGAGKPSGLALKEEWTLGLDPSEMARAQAAADAQSR